MTVYSTNGVFLSIGNREITGFGEGLIEFSRSQRLWENKACVDGVIVSSHINDTSATVSVTLRYDSPSNQVLQYFAENQGSYGFLCEWPNGDSLSSDEARVQSYPEITDGQQPGDRVWTIFLASSDYQFATGK